MVASAQERSLFDLRVFPDAQPNNAISMRFIVREAKIVCSWYEIVERGENLLHFSMA